jgi:hypothetical protein
MRGFLCFDLPSASVCLKSRLRLCPGRQMSACSPMPVRERLTRVNARNATKKVTRLGCIDSLNQLNYLNALHLAVIAGWPPRKRETWLISKTSSLPL